MNDTVKKNIFNSIKAFDKIVLSRHTRPDGDAIGSTHGLAALLKATFPEKEILVVGDDSAEHLDFLGPDDPLPPDEFYSNALAIVLDTGVKQRISNKKIDLAAELIQIDHHVPDDSYGSICWIEEKRSSTCEMIADFYATFREELVMTPDAALALYTGMVTDSDRFRYPSVTGDTLRLAAMLLDQGIDTESLYAYLYLEEVSYYRFKAYIYDHLQQTEHGVAYLHVTKEMQERFSLSYEEASGTIDLLRSLKGCLIWLVFIDSEDGSIRVRLRSRFTEVRPLAMRFHGGGHDRASGATVYSVEEAQRLIQEADAQLAAFKKEHPGWM
ncbi:MAG: bifunctional oligoribonuclease/PAP phosphatase NrnA [Lachnospiraceae bacterium]|nr:bifunctional oligoribonuclease/PAP phosphatase NrnA [Lachnospiraceae bacterium]